MRPEQQAMRSATSCALSVEGPAPGLRQAQAAEIKRVVKHRPRRLRTTPAMRAMVAETSLEPRQLILPLFVAEGLSEPRPISSMPGVVQHTLDTLRKAAVEAADAGLAGVMLFGIPEHKDARGSGALDPDGILNCCDPRRPSGGRRRLPGDVRRLPGRVHRSRALRRADPVRRWSTTTPRWRSTPRWPCCTPPPEPCGRAERDDGRPGRRHPGGTGRRRRAGRGDPGLRGEVRLGVLRPLPRGGRVLADGQPPDLPAGSGQRSRGAPGGRARRRQGADLVMVKPALATST